MAAAGEIGVSEFLQGTCRQTLFLVKKPQKHTSQLLWGTLCNRGRVPSSARKSLRLRCQAQENPRVVVSGNAASSVEQQSGLVEKPSAEVIHLYRVPFIQESAAAELLKEAQAKISNQIVDLKTEQCFNVGLGSQLSSGKLSVLKWLLSETFEPENLGSESFLEKKRKEGLEKVIVEVGPRLSFTTAWSANAVSICQACGLTEVNRLERSRRYLLYTNGELQEHQINEFAAMVHDRMTECVYTQKLTSFETSVVPEEFHYIPVMEKGRKALEEINLEMGFAFDDQDLEYYTKLFREDIKRNPTNVELFDIAQSNSEHSRHWFFTGKIFIDGQPMNKTLMQIVKSTLLANPNNSVIGFKDNSSAIRGFQVKPLRPVQPGSTSPLNLTERDMDILLTAETHNFPCAVAPYPGAETGAGGRIRDTHATGRGSFVQAATAGYCVGNLNTAGLYAPWEDPSFTYPSNLAPPLQILIDASNGASDYGNKFGEPLIQGFCRTFGMRLPSGDRREWLKPIMFSAGIGQIDHLHITKGEPDIGMLVVKIGGPAYRIGMGGGAASSMVSGQNDAELDFNAVQRGDAEMAQKLYRLVRACIELGDKNPIVSIHDQGAGGNCNVVKEIIYPKGAEIDVRAIVVGDHTMSVLEIWGAEYQEQDAILVKPESHELLKSICKRERVSMAVIGTISGDGRVVLVDSLATQKCLSNGLPPPPPAVDLELEKVLGDMPQKSFEFNRIVYEREPLDIAPGITVIDSLKRVLRLPSVCSKRFLTTKVDRCVTGLVAQQQTVGPLQIPLADVAVTAQTFIDVTGGACAIGEQPIKGLLDPKAMARLAVGEALTNLVWAKVTSLSDVKASGNWMYAAKLDGEGAAMYDAAISLSEAMIELGIAIDGGKDSLSMAAHSGSEVVRAPGNLVISVYVTCPDITKTVTPDLKLEDDGVLLHIDLSKGKRRLGGSALAQAFDQVGDECPDLDDVPYLKKVFEGVQELLTDELISAGHDISDGGLLVCASAIYGRDDDKKKLQEFLLSEDSSSDGRSKIGVISIVGMGGLGKTTLAKLIYNDHDVKLKFEVRGWAHVSKDLDVVTLTKTLLESVTSKPTTANNLNSLQVELQQSLRNKKYLLVLDDIWFGRYVGWNSLNDIFNVGEIGSKIIITTRDERVVLPMQAFLSVHRLSSLETEDCWTLLARHAFVEINYQQRPDLEKIGREIAKKCDGLPLAAVAVGGLLRTKLSQDHWNGVLKSNIWELPNDEVQPALLLSYRHLPASLKGCFAYCSIFPKNSILDKKMVVQLWIAEGLVPEPKGEKSCENIAEEYFDQLVSRSLICQRSIDGEEVTFEMHDLINDLAMTVSSPYCVRLNEYKPLERVRHLSYNKGPYDSYDKFDKLHGLKGLRTFLPLPLQEPTWVSYFVSDKLVCGLLPQMKQLRLLSLSHYANITQLPNSIGNLTYLRYLNLSHTNIEMLPSETCKLYNLQTLLLSHCERLSELPKDMGKLVNLRHLDIRHTQLKEMPVQLSQLENLQTLSDFVVSIQDVGLKITDLGKYPHLRGNLSISQLQNVTDSSHAFQANLEMKKQIDELVLEWFDVTPSNSQIQSAVLEQLRPSTNLKSLAIRGYGGNNFPSWLNGSLFCNMVCLRISHCENCSVLPPLGHLCNLKKLFIGEMKSIKSVGAEFYGSGSSPFQPFPSLETLEFEMMLEWEEWKLTAGTTGEFPRLTCLSLWNCPKLIGNIPLGQLGNLKKLSFLGLNSTKTLGTEFYGSSNSPLFQPFLSLETLEFWYMQEWEEWKLIGGTSTEFPSLTRLSLHDCPKLKGNIPGSLPNLTSLTVDNCPKLEGNMPDKLPSLTQLELCGLPTSDLVFRQLMTPLTSLHCLTIKNLSSLTSFPRDGLPKTLKSLSIWNCENLEFIPSESFHNYKLLEKLNIVNSGMASFTLGSFPVLNSLTIRGCKNLKSILIAKDASQHNLLFLSSIYIEHCDELDSVSLGGLSFPNLIYLSVYECKKLRSLPESIKTLSNLQNMNVCDLPNLQSFSMDDFPISLRELIVGNVGGILWNTSLECYTSLSELHITGDDIVMALMKMEVPFLPTSLVTLTMDRLEDIECLDGKWLQHLTSLEYLEIDTAPKLKSLAKDGKLPCSLKSLYINDCPLLKENFRRKRGKEWRKIAHIPFIQIDREMIT